MGWDGMGWKEGRKKGRKEGKTGWRQLAKYAEEAAATAKVLDQSGGGELPAGGGPGAELSTVGIGREGEWNPGLGVRLPPRRTVGRAAWHSIREPIAHAVEAMQSGVGVNSQNVVCQSRRRLRASFRFFGRAKRVPVQSRCHNSHVTPLHWYICTSTLQRREFVCRNVIRRRNGRRSVSLFDRTLQKTGHQRRHSWDRTLNISDPCSDGAFRTSGAADGDARTGLVDAALLHVHPPVDVRTPAHSVTLGPAPWLPWRSGGAPGTPCVMHNGEVRGALLPCCCCVVLFGLFLGFVVGPSRKSLKGAAPRTAQARVC